MIEMDIEAARVIAELNVQISVLKRKLVDTEEEVSILSAQLIDSKETQIETLEDYNILLREKVNRLGRDKEL